MGYFFLCLITKKWFFLKHFITMNYAQLLSLPYTFGFV